MNWFYNLFHLSTELGLWLTLFVVPPVLAYAFMKERFLRPQFQSVAASAATFLVIYFNLA